MQLLVQFAYRRGEWRKWQNISSILLKPCFINCFSKEQLDTKWVAGLGWGALWKPNQGGQLSTELQTSALYVISNEVCRKLYGSFIADTHICTFTDEADFCSHDAGGPLYYEEKMYGGVKLVGVMSFGGCLNGKPNGSMRVYKYLPWINQLITKN